MLNHQQVSYIVRNVNDTINTGSDCLKLLNNVFICLYILFVHMPWFNFLRMNVMTFI